MIIAILSNYKKYVFATLCTLLVIITGLVLLHNAPPLKKDYIATAFMADMVLTLPLMYYFILIKPLGLKKWRIVFVFACCCGAAYLILPDHQRHYILQLRKLTMVLELGMIFYGLTKLKQIRSTFKLLQADFPDISFNLHQSMASVLGNGVAVKFVASELTMLYFGLFWWKKQRRFVGNISSFSVYKESGYAGFFGVILIVCLIELASFHLLIRHYSATAATIMTILSFYGTIFFIGDFSAIIKNPVVVFEDRILLRTGLRWRAIINKSEVISAEKIGGSFKPGIGCFKGGVMKNSRNVLLNFNQPVVIERLYRKPIMVSELVLCIDNPEDFITKLIMASTH